MSAPAAGQEAAVVDSRGKLVFHCDASTCQGAFCVAPYLQNLALDSAGSSASVEVRFQLASGATTNPTVSYYQGACGSFQPQGTATAQPVPQGSTGPAHLYRASLAGLAAGASYCYQVSANGVTSARHAFRTPEAAPASYAFYVYGDTRANSPCLTSNSAHASVVAGMNDPSLMRNVRFILNNGDFCYYGCCQRNWWDQYFAQAQPLLAQLPLFTAPGNHESYDCWADSSSWTCSLDTGACGSCSGAPYYNDYFHPAGVYSFDHGNSRFIALDLISDTATADLDPLRNLLDSAKTDPAIDHVFLYYHAPMLTLAEQGHGHPCSSWQIANMAPLLEANGKVRAVFNGHTHYYERSKKLAGLALQSGQQCAKGVTPITYREDEAAGVAYIVAGGGGAGMSTPVMAPWMAASAKKHHFMKMTVAGPNVYGQTHFTDGTADCFTLTPQISGGGAFTCGLHTDGSVQCWGANGFGQVGAGCPNASCPTPSTLPGLPAVGQLATGDQHACAVLTDGTARCWGTNTYGQLGNGGTYGGSTPQVVSGLAGAVQIAAGSSFSCALLDDATVRCWGRLPDGSQYLAPTVFGGLSGVAQLSVRSDNGCALLHGGGVSCWNYRGGPVVVSGLTDALQVAVGVSHACALRRDGTIACWGSDAHGQLGDDPAGSSTAPVPVSGLPAKALQVAAGWGSTCALLVDRSVYCWGGALDIQGSYVSLSEPREVPGFDGPVQSITAGWAFYCALVAGGGARCWGSNSSGELGDGTTATPILPPLVEVVSWQAASQKPPCAAGP